MPPIHCPTWWIQEMSEKKSPPRKEKLLLAKSPQPSDGRAIKRKLIMAGVPQEEEAVAEKKHVTPKRKRMSFTQESSPTHGGTPRTPGSRLTVPLSERQQVALLMRMTDETSQGESSPKALSPQGTLSSVKKTPGDKKLHSRNARGETPLHIAAIKGDVKQTKKLIKAGAEVNAKDNAGWTPLHEACSRGYISLAKNLLKAGANVNIQSMDNDTPLHDAAGHGSHKLVELLLKHGANPLLTNSKGSTAVDAAASPDIDRLLRKEIIASSSESSSVDEARSPTSPESESSTTKEDDRQAEFDDLSPRLVQGSTHDDWERLSTMSSSSVRKSLIPQSPDIVGASPRVTLKFQHLKDRGMWSSGVPAKSTEFQQPQYPSYSVTVETGEERRGLLPGDSPCSSNDSDLYDPQLDTSSRRYEQPPPGGSNELDSKNRLFPSSNIDSEGWGRNSRDVNVDKNTCKDTLDSKYDHTVHRYPLTTHETKPFEPHFDFMSEEDASGDSFSTMRDADSSAVGGNIPLAKAINHARLKEVLCPVSSPPSDTFSQTTSVVSASTVSSTVATLNIGSSNPATTTDSPEERTEQAAQCASVSSSRRTPVVNSGALGNSLSAHPSGSFRWDLRSLPKTSVPDESIAPKVEESSMLPALIDREVRLPTKFDKDLRAASPKVPPLKIIFAPKATLSSSVDVDKLKLLLTKPSVPYVLNPTQEKSGEEQTAAPIEGAITSPVISRCSTPASSHGSSPAPGREKKTDAHEETTAVAEPAPSLSEQNEASTNEDKEGEGETTEEKDAGKQKEKDDSKEEEFTGRVTRSSARSQQQKEKHGPGSTDGPSQSGEASSTKVTKVSEELEDYTMHPRKRKLRPKSNETPTPMEIIQPTLVQLEKPPNPYEMFLEIRKQIEMRRKNLISVPPKVPQSFNEYLMVSCSYVIQGNAASNLAVPMLPPPNSVEGPMRDLFLEQENARYKLRLQHVIEREKLILSIEQEMVREHGRAARAEANQSVPFSVCTILKDEEIYNTFDGPEQTDEREKNVRGRYNGRQFLSWLHDVGVKYAKIKELLLFRHHHEAESLHAVQKMDWEWKLKEVGDCDYSAAPPIDELHVPMVPINEDFDLLPG